MDMAKQTIQFLNSLPYNALSARVINRIANCMQDGPVKTRNGYQIDFRKTGPFSTALRKLVISGSYERSYFQMLSRLMRLGDTAIDVGAHEGYVTLLMSQLVGGGRLCGRTQSREFGFSAG